MADQAGGDTVAALFDISIAAEQAAQKFYLGLTERYAHLPEVADFWRGMARDEATHARKLRQIRDSLTPEQLGAPVDSLVLWQAREGARFSAEEALESARTLEEAYRVASDLEHSEVNAVFETILQEYVGREAQRDFVVGQLQDHVNKLDEFGHSKWRGSEAWTE